MRTPENFMHTVLLFAQQNDHIRIVGMEGSRVNSNIPKDSFQDFDVTFFVDSIPHFTKDDDWLSTFGKIVMMQKPEDMELFPPVEEGYSYLILFDDYVKMDLTLLEIESLGNYLNGDSLREILLDKDNLVQQKPHASDRDYWIRKPNARVFDDCCNEFWNLTLYVVKGLCRGEILFAIDHLHLMRNELLRMLSWTVGMERGFDFSVGKNYKFLDHYLPAAVWQGLLSTYREDSYANIRTALFRCHSLFRQASHGIAEKYGYPYPIYDQNVSKYAEDMFRQYKTEAEENPIEGSEKGI